MATNPIKDQLYPFSTEDSKAIPLDIIRPLGVLVKSFLGAGVASVTIPAGWKTASFYSPTGCFIQFAAAVLPGPLLENVSYDSTLFVPPNCVVTSTVIEGVATIAALNSVGGYLVVQGIQKWAGLALARQASRV